jgi:hypothetical protein
VRDPNLSRDLVSQMKKAASFAALVNLKSQLFLIGAAFYLALFLLVVNP